MGVLERKIRREMSLRPETGFPAMSDMHYLSWLKEAHEILKPGVYFEIGTESGVSLSLASCESFAVDPDFKVTTDVVGKKPALYMYRGTSDSFFDDAILAKMERRVDLAFLDGMHLFEYLLRDFINTESNASANALIVMHDCVPVSEVMAARIWDKSQTRNWTGDVWKLIPILRRYRPDLDIRVIDAAPTALVLVRKLDPSNDVLRANYDRILAEFTPLTLGGFGLANFLACADLQDARSALSQTKPRPARSPVPARKPLMAIKICAQNETKQLQWGDYFFAVGLKRAFEKLGYEARIDPWSNWGSKATSSEVDIFLSGTARYTPSPDRASLFWLIYPRKVFSYKDLDPYAHVFVASEAYGAELAEKIGQDRVTTLLQAFDDAVMAPKDVCQNNDVVYVANNYTGDTRRMMTWALSAGLDIKVWGKGWAGAAESLVVDQFVPNEKLADLYSSAAAVLCDHHGKMAKGGFLSNRVYDALACGAAVIVDVAKEMVPARFHPYLYFASDGPSLAKCVEAARAETPDRRNERRAFGGSLLEHDNFDDRARTILNVLADLKIVERDPQSPRGNQR